MSSNVEQILYGVTTSTMEDLCFMFEEPDLDEAQFNLKNGKAALISFKGPFNGTMVLKASGSLINAIGENMLGEDELTDDQCKDALGEVSNVICGNVLPEISGSKKDVFDLSSPQIYVVGELPEMNSGTSAESVRIPLDEGFLEIQLVKE